ncbi:10084_t:CDS:1, partial [Funneliformis geosporum]
MPQEFSEDLYWRVVYLHTERLSNLEIFNTLYMSKGVINKIKRRYRHWMCVKNHFK